MESVLVEVTNRVASITLNRPEVRNALNSELRSAIPSIIEAFDHDPSVDVMILTGADPAFSAGLDLKELGSLQTSPEALLQPVVPPHTTPIIGAVNGSAVTGGLELALGCDFLVASERAWFADTHTRVGIMPGWGLSVLLPQAIGIRRAREMSTTGRYLNAESALTWGMVNHVVPHEELLPFCNELAADIVSSNSAAVQRLLRTYYEGSRISLGDAWDLEGEVAREWFRTSYRGSEAIERSRSTIVKSGHSQIGQT